MLCSVCRTARSVYPELSGALAETMMAGSGKAAANMNALESYGDTLSKDEVPER